MAIDHLTEIFRFYSFTVLHDQLIILVFKCVTWTMNINMNLWSVETAELERIQREGNSSGKDYIFPVQRITSSPSLGWFFPIPRIAFSHPKNEIFSIPRMTFFPSQKWNLSHSKDGIFQNLENFGFGLTSQFQDRAPLWPLKVIIVLIHCYEYSVRTYLAKH